MTFMSQKIRVILSLFRFFILGFVCNDNGSTFYGLNLLIIDGRGRLLVFRADFYVVIKMSQRRNRVDVLGLCSEVVMVLHVDLFLSIPRSVSMETH